MSRYIHRNDAGTYVYGFDRPLSQFFLDKGRDHLVGPLGRVYGTNHALRQAMENEGVWMQIPEDHREFIEGDLMF